MTNNGSNNWDVSYSYIIWLQNLLNGHKNISNITRCDDIIFEVGRIKKQDQLRVMCCSEYVMGITAVHRALHEFDGLNIIYAGGNWCKYTKEAKEFCLDSKIGLYVSGEINGALWVDEYWDYQKQENDN